MHTPLTKVIKSNAKTFYFDDKLPKLPVPTLKETFDSYFRSVNALVNEDLNNLKNLIDAFLNSEESQKLQNALLSRFDFVENWLENWWLDETYLKSRESLIPYWNISGTLSLHQSVWPLINSEVKVINTEIIRRSSRFAYSLMKYWLCLRFELIVPTKTRDNKPMTMQQMKTVFNSCRIPNIEKDLLAHYFRTADEFEASSHFILGCYGRIFVIDPIKNTNGLHTPESICVAFNDIAEYCEKNGPGPSLSTLTSLPRDEWAKYYDTIRKVSNNNAINIDLIQQSVFWLCLNNQDPPHPQMLLERSLKTDCRNIWADKSIYVSFYSNGYITFGADHAPMDGIAIVLAMQFIEDEIICGNGINICNIDDLSVIKHINTPITWKELTFELPSYFDKVIDNAHSLYLNLCKNIEGQTFLFSSFSRKISRYYRLHPDTVFQLFLQLAYVGIHGIESPASVYETANTRQFRRGRTETIRSCTIEAVDWMKAILELGPDNPKVTALFLRAHKAHNNLRTVCENGKGFDRHIFGLIVASKMSQELHSPLLESIINHPSWKASGSGNNFVLSTSPTGASRSMGAVAPMRPNGYGVFYRIVEDNCEAAVTSWRSEEEGKGSKLLKKLNQCFLILPLMFRDMPQSKL